MKQGFEKPQYKNLMTFNHNYTRQLQNKIVRILAESQSVFYYVYLRINSSGFKYAFLSENTPQEINLYFKALTIL